MQNGSKHGAAGLVPLLVRLLYPKMRKRSGRLGGKGAPGSARAAILNYLAALDSVELAPLVQLFLQPISSAFKLQQQQQQQQAHVRPSDSIYALRLAPSALLQTFTCSTCRVCWCWGSVEPTLSGMLSVCMVSRHHQGHGDADVQFVPGTG